MAGFNLPGMSIRVATPMVSARGMPNTGRMLRQPRHTALLRHRPWQIQPCLIAPVLAGETMQSLTMQARCVTDPLKSKFAGWWLEYYFFYIKLRDLNNTPSGGAGAALSDQMIDMLVNGTTPTDVNLGTPAAHYYWSGGGINFTRECLRRVVVEYFRDEANANWAGSQTPAIDNVPIAAVNVRTGLQSLIDGDATTVNEEGELAGEETALPAHYAGFEEAFENWRKMRAQGLVVATFEDYLNSFGVKAPQRVQEDEHRPELIRYIRLFQYPVNHVEPTTGTPTSAVSWSTQERASKKRFFREPGFIFGVTVARPKVYLGRQECALAHYMDNHLMWLPAVLADAPFTSVREFADNVGPLAAEAGTDENYALDMRDLFVHGDQFVNFDLSTGVEGNEVSLPDVASNIWNTDYATDADALALFADPGEDATGKRYVRQDAAFDLRILSARAAGDTSL